MAEVAVQQEKEALFSKKRVKLLTDPLNDNNPVTVQVLGICSAFHYRAGKTCPVYVCRGIFRGSYGKHCGIPAA